MDKILILDFGSQYTQLIARRIRELGVYSEIQPCSFPLQQIQAMQPKALILSGGPASVLGRGAPKVDPSVFDLEIPVLGICYGMQLMSHLLGGKVVPAQHREYGRAFMTLSRANLDLFQGIPEISTVWMSHGDSITRLPDDFESLATTREGIQVAMRHRNKPLFGLQFHAEVVHTEYGTQVLENFVVKIAQARRDWVIKNIVEHQIEEIRSKVLNHKVILGLSGGVDSTVAAVLIHRAIGEQLTCIFINNGLLRKHEAERVQSLFKQHYQIRLRYVNATSNFLSRLQGIKDPERKRKLIGVEFIKTFEREAKKIKGAQFLAQGTLYPDVIESVSFKGPSAVIKSHHNVGGLPKKMGLKLLEPFRELFKDEVRTLGRELGMPSEILGRHPFPGPGLGIRIIGAVTQPRLALLRAADSILLEEIKQAGLYDSMWQAFAVLLPVQSVGVMGDERTYENTCAIRAITSLDGMTADWVDLPHDLLSRIAGRIINEVRGINRVVYDITSKPPGTIEWE